MLSIPLEAANSGSLTHTYCLWKPPLEGLVESWHISSVEARDQLSTRDDLECTEISSSCSAVFDVPADLTWLSQGISGVE